MKTAELIKAECCAKLQWIANEEEAKIKYWP